MASSVQAPTKRPIACNHCRLKKIRCNGGDPCANCFDLRQPCVSSVRKRLVRKKIKENVLVLEDRLARMEALLQAANARAADENRHNTQILLEGNLQLGEPSTARDSFEPPKERGSNHIQDTSQPHRHSLSPEVLQGSASLHQVSSVDGMQGSSQNKQLPLGVPAIPLSPNSPDRYQERYLRDSPEVVSRVDPVPQTINFGPGGCPVGRSSHHTCESMSMSVGPQSLASDSDTTIKTPADKQEGSSVFSGEHSNWEYHGPRSFLSICSTPGIQWVEDRTGVPDFLEIAGLLTTDITRRLKINRRLPEEKCPEPDSETAWRFTKAYFERAPDAVFGVIHRPWFEAQLREQFDSKAFNDDPSWYALKNTVYASGCRLELAKKAGFLEAYEKSWRYFENALSVQTELLYYRTGILAVQALTVMAYYVEGLGSPCIEHMLCSSAMRLAQSKGLHRQAATTWKLSENEICHRNFIFWAIYCFEKHISYRSGRPSAVDDSDISCQIPTTAPAGSSANVLCCNIIIRHAQISAMVGKTLSTLRTFIQTPEEIISTVQQLDETLREYKESVQHILPLDSPIEVSKLPPDLSLDQALYLQYSYYGTLSDIHSVLTYPWFHDILCSNQHPAFRAQLASSSEIVAMASRSIILATKHIQIDAASPVLLAFFFPIYSLINLFIHILKYPTLPTVQSDIALMDVGAGHFGRVEFETNSELTFPFPRELATLVRIAVKRAKAASQESRHNNLTNPLGDSYAMTQMPPPGMAGSPGAEMGQSDSAAFEVSLILFHGPPGFARPDGFVRLRPGKLEYFDPIASFRRVEHGLFEFSAGVPSPSDVI